MSQLQVAGSLLALLATFALLSFLYRDNPLFRQAEKIFLGLAVGYWMTLLYWNVLQPNLIDVFSGERTPSRGWGFAIAASVLLLLLIARYFAPVAWLGRLPVALLLGCLAGLAAQGFLRGVLLPQLQATLAPLAGNPNDPAACTGLADAGWLERFGCSYGTWLNGWLILIATALALLFLLRPRPGQPALRIASRAGYAVLLVGFGVSFGYLVMDRVAVAIGRVEAALAEPALALLALLVVVGILFAWRRTDSES